MRIWFFSILGLLLICSCAHKRTNAPANNTDGQFSPAPQAARKLIITPDDTLVGRVARVDQGLNFVVLNFPIGHLPTLQQRLNLYRRGVKVGEVRVSGPQYDDNVVADLITGDPQIGDEVRKD